MGKKEWNDLFGKRPRKSKIEDAPYKCTICNSDQTRFKAAHTYAHHVNARHQFHKGFDSSLPEPSARVGFTLPKIKKKKKPKKAKRFENSKSGKRNKLKKKDYLPM